MRAETIPPLEEILGGRKLAMETGDEIETTAYFYFCNKLVECVAGKKEWKKEKSKLLISKSCITVSDEAFALLLMVNSWEKFEYIAEHVEIECKDNVPETRYTEKKGRNKKLQGWSSVGIDKFNQLCEMVKKDRTSAEGIEFEQDFLAYHEAEVLRKKGGSDEAAEDENESEDEDDASPVLRATAAYNHLQELLEIESDGDDDLGLGETENI
jgi:hypothetical protein